MVYQPKGVCSKAIDVEVEGSVIKSVKFTGGCNGNLQGISSLVAGMKIEDAISRLEGNMLNLIFLHKNYIIAILVLLFLSIICQITLGVIYHKLIWETEHMSSTANKSLQQFAPAGSAACPARPVPDGWQDDFPDNPRDFFKYHMPDYAWSDIS